jgi:hypothetical protein
MLAWDGERWIVAVAGLMWFVFARHFSADGLIGGMMGGIFAAITHRRFQTFWLRFQTAQQVCLLLTAPCVFGFLYSSQIATITTE